MLPADLPSRGGREKPNYGEVFSSALLDPEQATPECVAGLNGKTATKRYNVYRNNVTLSLMEALVSIFPAVQRITGVEFFRAMARFYVRANPPRSPLLFEYGYDFPDFIERYEYARSLPWLADVARIERAWLDCYHAADAEPLSATALASVPADRLAELVFLPHPAVRIVRSSFSAVSIFAANRNKEQPDQIQADDPEDALITRPVHDVVVRHLPAGGATFLTRLIEGSPLAVAVSAALEVAPLFDLSSSMAGMIDEGVAATDRVLTQILNRVGVEEIKALNKPFDPMKHEAVMERDETERPPGSVVQVLENGYTIHDRLLRPARVVVARVQQPSSQLEKQ